MSNELRDLVKDTLEYMRAEFEPGATFFCAEPLPEPTPKSVPKPEVKVEVKAEAPQPWKLEKLPEATQEPMREMEELVKKAIPGLQIKKEVPDDRVAKEIANAWKEQKIDAAVIILFSNENDEELNFLKAIAKAIHNSLAPTKIMDSMKIEKEKRWNAFLANPFRLIIVSSDLMNQMPDLKKHYRKEIPLLTLAPYSSYFTTPQLKRSLWQTLCSSLSS